MSSTAFRNSSRTTTLIRKLSGAAVVGAWSCLLLGLFGGWAWPLDLFANFRIQYLVVLVIGAMVLFATSQRRMAALSLAGAVVAAIPCVAYVAQLGDAAEAKPATFRLVSFNVWYRNQDLARVAQYLEGTHADAIVLQEFSNGRIRDLQALLPSYPHVVRRQSSRYGAVILSKWPIVQSRAVRLSSAGVNGSFATLDWQGTKVNLLGVHLNWPIGPLDSRLRNEELRSLAAFASQFGAPLLVAGDLNLTAWSPHFRQLLDDSGLLDGAVGHGLAPSWPSQLGLAGIRIDHCLMTPQWRSVSVAPGPHVGSDHRPLVAELQLADATRLSQSRAE